MNLVVNLTFLYILLFSYVVLGFYNVFSQKDKFTYDIKEFEVAVDHFNFVDNRTFSMRYLYNDTFAGNNSPIFFYTGNEGDIELFAQNSGFIWELAEQLKACVVFAEHRYYGKSLPFGNATFDTSEHQAYLSVEQTLEDFVKLITHLRSSTVVPVIAFGGSYGGMLSAWLRMKYPHIVVGALAASAPIWQFNGLTPCNIYSQITNSVFAMYYSSNCSVNIKSSWNTFKNYSSTADGRKYFNAVFKFCNPLDKEEDVNDFFDYLEDVYGSLAMANYPYQNDFLVPLPAYPVLQFCSHLQKLYIGEELLNAMQKAVSVYTNFTGDSKCLDYKSVYGTTLGGVAWDVQMCNQMVMPMCSYANETMFRNKDWNFQTYSETCFRKFKIRPSLNDIILRYGGKDLRFASNIIFSNGLLDPWSGGGVLRTPNNKITVIIIPEGAHHLDLRHSDLSDPPSVLEARKQELKIISRWISNFSNEAIHITS